MTHEKIFRHSDGVEIKIWVRAYETREHQLAYRYNVGQLGNDGSVFWLAQNAEGHVLNESIITKQEILEAKLELWEQLKPVEGI